MLHTICVLSFLIGQSGQMNFRRETLFHIFYIYVTEYGTALTTILPILFLTIEMRVITKLQNSEQSYKEKVKTHNYTKRQNQSTTGKL
jgi:hypothetical protein